MKSIKLKSVDCIVHIVAINECPPAEGVWFRSDEWSWALRLSQAFEIDPERKNLFWTSILANKQENAAYSLFTDFPKSPEDDGLLTQVPEEQKSEARRAAEIYAPQIIAKIKGFVMEKDDA